jgi:TolB protein
MTEHILVVFKKFINNRLLLIILGVLGLALFGWAVWSGIDGLINKPQVAFLSNPLESPEIWVSSLDGRHESQLTFTNGEVVDFSVSTNGRLIVFSAKNNQGGSDLYLIRSNGKNQKMLINCGGESCIQPKWSPDGRLIAYSRFQSNDLGSGNGSNSQIWTVNVESGQTGALFSDPQIKGKLPVFSPDNRYLAFYDTTRYAIHLFDMLSGRSEFIPTQFEESGSFSPGSNQIVFSDYQSGVLIPVGLLYIVDLSSKSVTPLLGDELTSIDTAYPEWSSTGDWILFSVRVAASIVGRQLWIVHSDGTGLKAITDDPTYNCASANWSKDDSMILFQRLKLGSSGNLPEVVSWTQSSGSFNVIAENAALPAWIP